MGRRQSAAHRRRPRRQPAGTSSSPSCLPSPGRQHHGGGGRAAAAAAGAGLHGVDGAAGRHAGVVVGGLRAPARRLPRLPQDGAAPARRLAAGRRRLHVAHAAPRPQHAPAGLADHHRRAQIRAGGLQRAVVAGAGRQHARPPVVPAAARAGADAAVPYRGGAGLGRHWPAQTGTARRLHVFLVQRRRAVRCYCVVIVMKLKILSDKCSDCEATDLNENWNYLK